MVEKEDYNILEIHNVVHVKVVDVHLIQLHKNVFHVVDLVGYFMLMVVVQWKLNVIIVMDGVKLLEIHVKYVWVQEFKKEILMLK